MFLAAYMAYGQAMGVLPGISIIWLRELIDTPLHMSLYVVDLYFSDHNILFVPQSTYRWKVQLIAKLSALSHVKAIRGAHSQPVCHACQEDTPESHWPLVFLKV